MLYDPKWEVPAETKVNPFELATLIAWLEKQKPSKKYCYMDLGNCLFAQYFTAHGFVYVSMGGWSVTHGSGQGRKDDEIPKSWIEIAHSHPRTFGGALDRARTLLD